MALLGAAGRMSLSSYVAQSLILAFVFYGYGLGLQGRLSTSEALPIAVGVFVALAGASRVCLSRFRFGPLEWLLRRFAYGRFGEQVNVKT